MNKDSYISRGVRLDTDVWAALEGLKEAHGSYNKGLRVVLLEKPAEIAVQLVKAPGKHVKAFTGPIPKPSEGRKK